MNVNMIPADRSGIKIPRNEYLCAQKVRELFSEAEFTGLSENVRIDSRESRWFLNNDPYTKVYGKYDAYAYEWTVGTGTYSENGLLYIGKTASSLPQNFENFNSAADEETIGFTLGTVMVKTLELGKAMGVSGNASDAVKAVQCRSIFPWKKFGTCFIP